MPRKSKYTTESFLKELNIIRKKHKSVDVVFIALALNRFMKEQRIDFDLLISTHIEDILDQKYESYPCGTPSKQIQVTFKKPRKKTSKRKPGRPRKEVKNAASTDEVK